MQFYFWKNWQKPVAILYSLGLLVFLLAIVFYFLAWLMGMEWAMSWQKVEDLQSHPFILESFTRHFFNFDYQVDTFLLINEFIAQPIQVPQLALWAYCFFLFIAWHFLLTSATFLTRVWYGLFTGLWLVFLSLAHLELLAIFEDRIFVGIVALSYLLVSYLLYATENKLNFLYRFLILGALGLFFIGIIAQFSDFSAAPLLFTNYAMIVPLAFMLVFVGINAHEILRAFLFLVNEKGGSKQTGLRHFLIISSIYLLNLLYVYFYNIKSIDWGIIYVSPFLLLPLTSVLGLWGFSIRQRQYAFMFNFAPQGAFIYLAFALMSLSATAYAFMNANDVLVEVFEDIILYLHFGIGLSFVFYVLSNYINFSRSQFSIHQILYEGGTLGRMDFYWVKILGVVIMLTLLSRTDYFTYRQAWAGYFNYLGDFYVAQNENLAAEQQYRKAAGYEFQNHKSNYSLAYLAWQKNDLALAYTYFQKALSKQAQAQSYANLGHLLNKRDDFLQAIFLLNEANSKFPRNEKLINNTALMFGKTDIADSCFYYFDVAKNLDKNNQDIDANFYAFWAKFDFIKKMDSINQIISPNPSLQVAANELVMRNKLKSISPKALQKNYLPDSTLSRLQLCYLYNFALNQYTTADSSWLATLRNYEKYSSNSIYKNFLGISKFFKLYGTSNHWQALQELKKLSQNSDQVTPQYDFWLANYYMFLDRPAEASEHYAQAYQKGRPDALFYQCLALLELPNKLAVLPTLQKIAQDSTDFALTARQIYRLVNPDSIKKLNFDELPDIEKYWFAHYNPNNLDANSFQNLLDRFKNSDRKILCGLNRINYLLKKQDLKAAQELREKLQGIKIVEQNTLQKLAYTDLDILYYAQRWTELEHLLKNTKFDRWSRGRESFYRAVVSKDAKESEKYALLALQQMPLDEKVPIFLAQHYQKQGQKQKAYEILADYTYRFEDALLYPVELSKAYILAALEMGFVYFAEPVMEDLKILMSAAEYQNFEKIYQQKKQALDYGF